jgi:hypothetical protein
MALQIRDKKDFNAGLMFMAIGGGFVAGAFQYPMGTAVRMGPAYFPSILGGICFILGFITFARSFFYDGEPPSVTKWRPLLLILGSVVTFGLLVGPAGVVIATMSITLLSAFGGHEFRWVEQVIVAVVMAITTVSIFYYGLGLPFRLFPWS